MQTTTRPQGITTPTVTFSTLAKVMGSMSPTALRSRLHDHKYPSPGKPLSYVNALNGAVEFLVNGTPLLVPAGLRPHEKDVLGALKAMRPNAPRGFTGVRPTRGRQQRWNLNGVDVSVFPDIEFRGTAGASGAGKFSFTKDRLPRGVGSIMAALLWHHRSTILGIQNVQPNACIVYEPRTNVMHRPGTNPAGQVANAAFACQLIASIWPHV